MQELIRVDKVWKKYRDTESTNGAALRGATLSVKSGELIALYGKSGSGKTSLLNILAGLDNPSKGIVEIEGENIFSMDEKKKTNLIIVDMLLIADSPGCVLSFNDPQITQPVNAF